MIRKRKITKVEDLAVMVQKEFISIRKEFGQRFDHLDGEIAYLRSEVADIRADLDEVKRKLGEMVFRFEIQNIERRLKRVELKVGLGR